MSHVFQNVGTGTRNAIIAQRYVDQFLRSRSYMFQQDNAAMVTMDLLCQNLQNHAVDGS